MGRHGGTIFPALRRLRQEDCKLKASLERSCLEQKKRGGWGGREEIYLTYLWGIRYPWNAESCEMPELSSAAIGWTNVCPSLLRMEQLLEWVDLIATSSLVSWWQLVGNGMWPGEDTPPISLEPLGPSQTRNVTAEGGRGGGQGQHPDRLEAFVCRGRGCVTAPDCLYEWEHKKFPRGVCHLMSLLCEAGRQCIRSTVCESRHV
jgi:hypothetical protein